VRTNAPTQARHWFQGAIFDLVCWRGEDKDADLMIAVPDFVTYRTLASRIGWLAEAARFQIARVYEDGSVKVK
jgi:hypothetical protein